jgi:RimJ/RimL family protein N-acetyltransferase
MRHMGRGAMSREESADALARYQRHWEEHGFGLFAVTDKATGELIGRSGVQYHRAWPHDPEVGWGFDPKWWGRGLATEAGRACVDWAFRDLGNERLVSITTEANVTSRRVMAKLGFELHQAIPFPELGIGLLVHALDRPAAGKATAGAGTLLLRAP